MTKSQNTKKDLCITSEQLTEQWKKGELPEGYYYCKLILNNMKPSVERCKAHCIPMGVSADKGEEVLAPVPSYEEWQAKLEENAQLKELLEECSPYIGLSAASRTIKNSAGHKKDMKLLTKIDEALK